jgi:2-phosphosulfolactate phosphatase
VTDSSSWSQGRHRVRCEWGPVGAARVAADAVVVVDVLSFTTSVSVLVDRATAVVPAPWRDGRAAALAAEHGAALAVGRREVTPESPWSLSPAALRAAPATERLVLPSPNGSAIAAAATGPVVAACLRNAGAVGRWLASQGYGSERSLTVVPAGERWPDGSLRPAVEDLLGAGALLAALDLPSGALSPEAAAARAAFLALGPHDVADAVRASASGQELVEGGFAGDVEVAVELDRSTAVPVLVAGCFRAADQ